MAFRRRTSRTTSYYHKCMQSDWRNRVKSASLQSTSNEQAKRSVNNDSINDAFAKHRINVYTYTFLQSEAVLNWPKLPSVLSCKLNGNSNWLSAVILNSQSQTSLPLFALFCFAVSCYIYCTTHHFPPVSQTLTSYKSRLHHCLANLSVCTLFCNLLRNNSYALGQQQSHRSLRY